jgi:hypothetical protein
MMSSKLNLGCGEEYEVGTQASLPVHLWRVGDVVTRDGTDEHIITQIADRPQEFGDVMTVKCIKEPAQDGFGNPPWCKLGEEESNLTRRYTWLRHSE